MITTIQIHDNVKKSLESLKESKKDSYENVIVRLLNDLDKQKRKQEKLIMEGCKEMAEDSLRITKEFEPLDARIDWEWNDD